VEPELVRNRESQIIAASRETRDLSPTFGCKVMFGLSAATYAVARLGARLDARRRASGCRGVLRSFAACGPMALACACGDVNSIGRDELSGAPASSPDIEQTAWPGRFALPDGSVLLLEAPPAAVVPGSAGSVDMLCALLPPKRLAGLPHGSDRYSALRDSDSPYLRRPSFVAFRAEQLLGLAPDLVIAHSWQPADTIARLKQAGVPVLRLADANRWADLRTQFVLLGSILAVEDQAAALLSEYDRRVADLLLEQNGVPTLTAVCYSNGGAGGWAAGSDTMHNEMLRLAGLTNLAAEQGLVGHDTMTFEELLVLDPDVLVVGGAADGQQAGGTAALLRESDALAALSSVSADRIVELPSWLYDTTSQYVVDAAEQLARATSVWRRGADR